MANGNNNAILGTVNSFCVAGNSAHKDESGHRRIKGKG